MIEELDQYYRPCGPCIFCGHEDKRHRLWDTFMDMNEGGDSPEVIAACFETPLDHVKAVLRLKPYK